MEGNATESQPLEVDPSPSGPGQQPKSGGTGCMIAFSIMAMLFGSLLVSCVMLFGSTKPDFRESRIEIASPNGKRVAILDRYREGEYFLSADYYDNLTLSDEGRVELVGKLPVGPAPQWLSDERLLVTLNDMWMPKIRSRVLGVNITLHLSDRIHVESRRKEVEGFEADLFNSSHAGPNDKQACERQHRAWKNSREFWAWAREATDNGDPDPGPWVGKYYPADCSTLSKH